MRNKRKEWSLGDPEWTRDTAMQYRQSRKRQHKDRKKIGTMVEMLDEIYALTPEDKDIILRVLRPYLEESRRVLILTLPRSAASTEASTGACPSNNLRFSVA